MHSLLALIPVFCPLEPSVSATERLCAELRTALEVRAATSQLLPEARAAHIARRGRDLGLPLGAERLAVAVAMGPSVDGTSRAALARWGGRELAWIPPVPGRHDHGRWLVEVPFDAVLQLATWPQVVRVEHAERCFEPLDDLARIAIGTEAVLTGTCVHPMDGGGVRVAVLDSGLDLAHPDLPVPAVARDVTAPPGTDGSDVTSSVSAHGTMVAGAALGRGTLSGGLYRGSAPGAQLLFYKTGSGPFGISTEAGLIAGIQAAVADGARVINLSHGSYDPFMDGSSALCQAVDGASAAGVVVVAAAGNEGNARRHVSGWAAPGAPSEEFLLVFQNVFPETYEETQRLQLAWRDGNPGDANLELVPVHLEEGAQWNPLPYDASLRGTESRGYELAVAVPPGALQIFRFRVVWSGPEPEGGPVDPVEFHITRWQGLGLFLDADPQGTLMTPGIADTALTVGAYVHRQSWTSAGGEPGFWPLLTEGELAVFSSRGPRIDGLLKPELLGPGAGTITLRDPLLHPEPLYQVAAGADYQGGPAYWIALGTSFAAPHIAGACALVLQAAPHLSGSQVRQLLMEFSDRAQAPDPGHGYGLPDTAALVRSLLGQECQSLYASFGPNAPVVGSAVGFQLDAGPAFGGANYLVLGSATATHPAASLGDGVAVALVADVYSDLVVLNSNQGPFQGFFGALDALGRAQATLYLPEPLPPSLHGLSLHHAFVIVDPVEGQSWVPFASNTVTVQLGGT